jgi:hypothetical protein
LRKVPSIVFLPHIDTWWNSASEVLKDLFLASLYDMDAHLPVLLLATADNLTDKLISLFGNCFEVTSPGRESREQYFGEIAMKIYEVTFWGGRGVNVVIETVT